MNKNHWFLRQIVLAAFAFGALGCGNYTTLKHPSSGGQDLSQSGPPTLEWTTVKAKIFQPYCYECHSAAGGNAGGINFETCASTLPNLSDIQSDVSTDDMPAAGGPVPDADKAILFAWINAGGPEFSNLPLPSTPAPASAAGMP